VTKPNNNIVFFCPVAEHIWAHFGLDDTPRRTIYSPPKKRASLLLAEFLNTRLKLFGVCALTVSQKSLGCARRHVALYIARGRWMLSRSFFQELGLVFFFFGGNIMQIHFELHCVAFRPAVYTQRLEFDNTLFKDQ
jgi:hypothetical protein